MVAAKFISRLNIPKSYFKLSCLFISLVAFIALALGGRTLATYYGEDTYGSCAYQTSCSSSTRITLPGSGLEVGINLQDGQIIPIEGYTIIVTPLNGQNTTFKQSDFYINGVLVHTELPSEDGTARWLWQPEQEGNVDISVVVTDQDGKTITQEFHIVVARSNDKAVTAPSASSPLSESKVIKSSLLGRLIKSIERFIRNLPPILKRIIPYILFLILLADILLMLVYIRRERDEYRALQALLKRERQSGQLKQTFTQLISHYLRTPLTVIIGAVDLLRQGGIGVMPDVLSSLQADVQELKARVDRLITQATDANKGMVIQGSGQALGPKPAWQQPILLIPVAIIGIAAFSFDYLAQHAGGFSVNQLNLVIQVVMFSSLAAALYVAVRSFKLRQYNLSITRHILQQEVAFNQVRDTVIENASFELNSSLKNLDVSTAKIPPSQALSLLHNGQQKLHDIVAKFVVARQLKTTAANATPVSTTVRSVATSALQTLQKKAQAKAITVGIMQDLAIQTTSPELLTFVVQTILDNAIEYSPLGGHVEVGASQAGNELKMTVTDHGPGIPADKQALLFQAFSKVEGSEVFNHEGLGFSLYLDKLIMNYLVGDIAVEAVKPQGTRVTLTLSI